MSQPTAVPPPSPRGIAFPIPEHIALRAWAEAAELHLVTEIDRVVAGEEYEEVLAFYEPENACRRLCLWRTRREVVLEPASGPAKRFEDIWDTMEAAAGLIRPRDSRRSRRR